VAGWWSPRTRVFLGLGVLHVVGCQCRCSTTAALGPARWWPFGAVVYAPQLLSSVVGFAPGFITRMSAVCGWSCGFTLVFSALICVQCPAMLMSRSNRPVSIVRAVTRVDVPIQPGEFVFSFYFLFRLVISQDHSLVFSSSISMKHALSCAVR
jgi:hypothetical protein